ncbi:sensor domain-containing protein [Streptomyces sp. NBC_00091]|uniref:sensor histidine kinase n=1 Tax=Streptomyces sp. NBC_00091 TaxID=2975648 RepID=UPI002257DA15|nr:sensor domain-containing protein [Streptomyces sp. NBC_00091]MCX5381327.1 sensor domain-containing protein [Streptomyces sp. NBC_00091]
MPASSPASPVPPVTVWRAMRRPLRFLVSWWPWRCWAYLGSGFPLGYGVLLAVVLLVGLGVLLAVAGVGLLLLVAALAGAVPLGELERRRLRWVEPEPVPDPHTSLAGAGPAAWLRTRLRERATWREFGYAALLGVVFGAAGFGVIALLAFSLLLVAAPVIVWALAPEPVMLMPGEVVAGPLEALGGTAVGLAGMVLAAYAGALIAGAQVKTARLLLGPREEDDRVLELTRSRVRLVEAFEAERRRIERDLHDGAQQQLVALSMTLGLAELKLRGVPEAADAAALVSRGRGEAQLALAQLRDLVRGIHPQVLTDHGLAAAVAEVALRHPVPVSVDLELPRLPEPVEITAYFTVAEALANAAKHSGASRVGVAGRVEGGRLTLTITDDGRGGADPGAGAGLAGLADRVAMLQGRLTVSSPLGGPTELRVEVPCSG